MENDSGQEVHVYHRNWRKKGDKRIIM